MLHRLCGLPSIPLSFTLASILPRRETYRVSYHSASARFRNLGSSKCSFHRLRLGLIGYLILLAPLAFVSQCQCRPRKVLSPLVFFPISTHFTAPQGIPFSSTTLKLHSFCCLYSVKLKDLTTNLRSHLQTLYAQSIRITLASHVLPQLLARS